MCIYIRAMSDAQTEVFRSIKAISGQIDEHIIRLCLYPHAREVNHWKKEIYSFLKKVPKLKGSNKFPKASLILKGLQIYNDMIDKLIIQTKAEEESLSPVDVSEEAILKAIESYQSWISSKLSSEGIVNLNDVREVLSEVAGCD